MDYQTRHMVARRPFRHEGQALEPGATFHASAVDAGYLKHTGMADEITGADGSTPTEVRAPAARTAAPSPAVGGGDATSGKPAALVPPLNAVEFAGAAPSAGSKVDEAYGRPIPIVEGTTAGPDTTPAAKPSEGLTVTQLREELAKREIDVPPQVTLKADLAALLDGAEQG